MTATFRYDAFISYRHRQPDKGWADWLVRALETYAPPRGLRKSLDAKGVPSRVARVFRDEDETSAGGDLSQQLKAALEESRALIVVCSRNTPASPWINHEVEYFESLGRAAHVLPLLVEGEPGEAFPPALLDNIGARIAAPAAENAKDVEPLAADVRPVPGVGAREVKRRALLKLVAGVLGVRYDDLYQRDRQRRHARIATVAGLAAATVVGSLAWLGWTRTDAYQVSAVVGDGPALVASAVDDDVAAWCRALVFSGRIDEALAAAQATTNFGGAQVKAYLAVAAAVADKGDQTRADGIAEIALLGIDGFRPPFRAELRLFAAERYARRGRRDEAIRVVVSALEDAVHISDTAERVSSTQKFAQRLVEWRAPPAGRTGGVDDPIATALLQMETARAAHRSDRRGDAPGLALASVETARRIKPPVQRAYVTAYLVDAAAAVDIVLPATYLNEAIAMARASSNVVAKSQALRQVVLALLHSRQTEAARALLPQIAFQEDRDQATQALIGAYARTGKAQAVETMLEEETGRDGFGHYSVLTAAGEGMADGAQDSMLSALESKLSEEDGLELRVTFAERLRATGRDNREALTHAIRAVTNTGPEIETSEYLSRIAAELVATGRVEDARKLLGSVKDPHAHTFALIGIAKASVPQRTPAQIAALMEEAVSLERTVPDPDLVAAGLREIGRVLSQAGFRDQAKTLFREAIERAATQGETGSSTIADAAAELARLGELRAARVSAARYCTAGDRLRVYATILHPSAELEEADSDG